MTMRRLGSSVESVFSASGSSMKKDALPSVDRSTPMVPPSACTRALTRARLRPSPAWVYSRWCAIERLEDLFAQLLGHADNRPPHAHAPASGKRDGRHNGLLRRSATPPRGVPDGSGRASRSYSRRDAAWISPCPRQCDDPRGGSNPADGARERRLVSGPPNVARRSAMGSNDWRISRRKIQALEFFDRRGLWNFPARYATHGR